jgi:hypothetical protein
MLWNSETVIANSRVTHHHRSYAQIRFGPASLLESHS